MTDFSQQIADVEKEIRETPYHKGTEEHIGKLRARLARLKDRELESEIKKGGGGGGGYAVKKQGDATVVLIGPPSSGKSTLINLLTNAESKVAPYAFTTLSVIPGMMKYKDAYIQILDIPGLIAGAKEGKGRGLEVLSVARGADLLLIMSDVERQKLLSELVSELEGSGIRINKKRPAVRIEKLPQGGITVKTNIPQLFTKTEISGFAHEFGLRNADIYINERLSLERLIDSFSENRAYIPAIFVLNKSELLKNTLTPVGNEIEQPFLISCFLKSGIEELKENIWNSLELARIYLVRKDDEPNLQNPMIVKKGDSLKNVAEKLGEKFTLNKRFAKIWGPSAKFPGQEVSFSTKVEEGMVIKFL